MTTECHEEELIILAAQPRVKQPLYRSGYVDQAGMELAIFSGNGCRRSSGPDVLKG